MDKKGSKAPRPPAGQPCHVQPWLTRWLALPIPGHARTRPGTPVHTRGHAQAHTPRHTPAHVQARARPGVYGGARAWSRGECPLAFLDQFLNSP